MNRPETGASHRLAAAMIWIAVALLAGCQPGASSELSRPPEQINKEHLARFSQFELPRKIGTVENVGLQIPVISPDGQQMLYLRTDCQGLSPMTLLGSAEPADTPTEGSLSVWLRPAGGTSTGQPVSEERWSHSAVWSVSGRCLAYVVNEPPFSHIVHVDLGTGERHRLGVPNAVNCLPRFNRDDDTLLLCSGQNAGGPFRVWRQSIEDREPLVLTPPEMDCVLPLVADDQGNLVCARAKGEALTWIHSGPEGIRELASRGGVARRPDLLQVWAGIASPLAPDESSFLFFTGLDGRIAACQVDGERVVRHRLGSIAACWLDHGALALATADGVFLVNTITGLSPGLFNGAWIPARYVPASRRLLLFGRESTNRLSVVEVVFNERKTS